jgi:type I restriction enzyme M protein
MLNSETKRHIDAARDVLVGVAPNPMTQIDQITYALIYKFMDDMDQASINAGGEPSFFVGELEPYAWSRLLDSRMGNQERINLYGEALQRFSEARQLPELFRTIFRAAFLPYRSPETLGLFLKEISHFDYSHPEELGNAYEYLLSIMSSQGDAGQFRTPRHIIDFMVDIVNPTKDDKVLDPACGTGGFLVATYNHILEQHDGKDDPNKTEQPLTPDERKKLMNNLEGYDIDPSMVRIAQVNMYLHQFKNPQIFQYDSLTSEERWNDKFDVVLANPPFMSPKGGIKPHSKFALQSNRAEVLFVDYIVNHLKPNGRAAIIVPEGIIFQSGKVYKQLRKELVEGGLYGVVSLPAGVFNPYSGVKTSILLINNEIAKQRDEILFVKIAADGYHLGATKRPVEKNDLPEALSQLRIWIQGGATNGHISMPVSKSVISSNADFNLNVDRYTTVVPRATHWGLVRLGDVAEVISGQSPEGKYYNENGEGHPFYQGKTQFTDKLIGAPTKWTTSVTKLARAGDILMSVRAPVGPVNIATQEICIGRGLAAIRPSAINRDFMFYVLKFLEDKISGNGGSVFDSINKKQIEDLEVPLPPMEIQEQIVTELDGYAAIIDGAKKIVENWKPRIDVDPEWPLIAISDLADIKGGATPSRKEPSYWGGDIEWLTASNIANDGSIQGFEGITQEGLKNCSSTRVQMGTTILVTRVSVGKVGFCAKDGYAFNQDLTGLIPNEARIHPKFLYYSAWTLAAKIEKAATGTGVRGVTRDFAAGLEVPTPPLAVQNEIVEQLEKQEQSVKAAFELLADFEIRVAKIISSLWNA